MRQELLGTGTSSPSRGEEDIVIIYPPSRNCFRYVAWLLIGLGIIWAGYQLFYEQKQSQRIDKMEQKIAILQTQVAPTYTPPPSLTPVISPTPLPPTPTIDIAHRCGATVRSLSKLRTHPHVTADVLLEIREGTQVWVTGRAANGQWWRVQVNSTHGWVLRGGLDVFEACLDDVPVVNG